MSSLFMLDTAGNQELLNNETTSTSTLSTGKAATLGQQPSGQEISEQIEINERLLDANESDDEDEDEDEEDKDGYFDLKHIDLTPEELANIRNARIPCSPTSDLATTCCQEAFDAAVRAQSQPKPNRKRTIELDLSDFNRETGEFDEENLWKTDVVKKPATSKQVEGLDQRKAWPSLTKKAQRGLNRVERSKTKGKSWFNLPATEVTEEVQNELKILQMRSALDPKHFYKKNDLKVLPKYFQIGTVQHSALDHYSERNTRKNKKKSMVDELLADTEAQAFTKRKYKEIMVRRDKYAQRKATQKMKKLKKNKK